MDEMSRKKLYIWRLARFLTTNGMRMSAGELADHLNRNGFRTGGNEAFAGGRGTHRLISATYYWVKDDLGLGTAEADPVPEAFVKADGNYAWKPGDPAPDGEE